MHTLFAHWFYLTSPLYCILSESMSLQLSLTLGLFYTVGRSFCCIPLALVFLAHTIPAKRWGDQGRIQGLLTAS